MGPPEYAMDATWQHFLEIGARLVLRVSQAKNLDPTLNQDSTLMISVPILMVS